jgi:hypothetical protein
MALEVWDPKNYRKTMKMWNHSELVEQVGGHQYPPGSLLLQKIIHVARVTCLT